MMDGDAAGTAGWAAGVGGHGEGNREKWLMGVDRKNGVREVIGRWLRGHKKRAGAPRVGVPAL